MSSALLLDEPLLCYQPALVRRLGLAEAAIVQQLHYWLRISTNIVEGERWVYKTYSDWADEIGISAKAVRGALNRLREAGVAIAMQSPLDARDKTLWWRIDYDALESEPGSPDAPRGSQSAPQGSPDARGGISHAGVQTAVQRLRTESTGREFACAKPVTYEGRRVPPEVVEDAEALLSAFNDEAGRKLTSYKANGQPSRHLRQIIGALLENHGASLDEWTQGLRLVVAEPPSWTHGAPAELGDVFGPRASARTLARPAATVTRLQTRQRSGDGSILRMLNQARTDGPAGDRLQLPRRTA